ncbi:lipopolysaccharide biosynthesis protein [Methylobacterium sp. NI91]|nr:MULTISPECIES: GumC family protein [unclassified Methylobacterium]QIJ76796.1 lipopolysaccharide biosynthesis protein [Methylobacterium sp. CLZ]QIJ81699.1 lipopolysaccharide biosynthesis protein [Methylobacterium sp. NI91]
MTTYPAVRGAIPLSSLDWPAASAGQSPSITPTQLLAMLRRRRRLIVLSMILGVLGGAVFIAGTEPKYVATAQVIIDPRALRVVEREVTPSVDNADGQVASVENEMRVLRSSTVLGALIARDRLDEDPEFAGDPPCLLRRAKATLLDLVGLSPARVPDPRRAALQALERKIAVRRAERSFVVEVHVATRDPDKSARIANDLVTLYTEQASRTRAELTRRSGASLDDRLAELRAAVRAAESRVETFRSEHDLVSADGALTRDRRLRDLNTQLAAARARSAEALVRMEQASALRGRLDGLSEAVQSQAMIQLRYQIAEARRRRANLANVLGPRHPELNSVGREIDALQDQLGQELQRIGDAARNDYRRAKQTEEELRRTVETMSTTSLADDRALAELRTREAEAEAQRKLFAQYLVRSRELIEQTQVNVNNIRVIGAAIPPEKPTNLSKVIVLALGTLVGLALGILAAVALGVLRGEAATAARSPTGSGEAARA